MGFRDKLKGKTDQVLKPNATTSSTFWNNLSPQEKKDSVDQRQCWKFNNKRAWNASGPVARLFLSNTRPALQKDFNGQWKQISRRAKGEVPYDFSCWMVGDTLESARPMIIVRSTDDGIVKNGVKVIKKNAEIQNLGFQVDGYGPRA